MLPLLAHAFLGNLRVLMSAQRDSGKQEVKICHHLERLHNCKRRERRSLLLRFLFSHNTNISLFVRVNMSHSHHSASFLSSLEASGSIRCECESSEHIPLLFESSVAACHIWSAQHKQCSLKLLTSNETRVMQSRHRKMYQTKQGAKEKFYLQCNF